MKLFRAVKQALGDVPIVAEDLGELFPSVYELLAESGFPGMKVLQFAFGLGDSEYLPHNHPVHCVVYTGTHDNTTAAAWYRTAAPPLGGAHGGWRALPAQLCAANAKKIAALAVLYGRA